MKHLLLSALILAYPTLYAQLALEKIWESDSVTIRKPQPVQRKSAALHHKPLELQKGIFM